MKRFIASAFLLGIAWLILTSPSSDKPKAEASPVPPIDVAAIQAESAAKDARIAKLEDSLRVASTATSPSHAESEPHGTSPAPVAEGPTAGVFPNRPADGSRETGESDAYSKSAATSLSAGMFSSAAFVAAVPMRPLNRSQQCAGGVCQQPASEPRRIFQAQPVRRWFGGRIFGRR